MSYITNKLQETCIKSLSSPIKSITPISGGDISQAFRLETDQGSFFLKINSGTDAFPLFESEVQGLQALRETGLFRIPQVIKVAQVDHQAMLLMEFVASGHRKKGFWESFAQKMAQLHQHSQAQFGWSANNFIGSLPQSNRPHDTFVSFYVSERLEPQFKKAYDEGLFQPSDKQQINRLYQALPKVIPTETPSLIHGDLWSGNFLVSDQNEPVLFDPSVAYSHRELDLAMSRLFGGFDRTFYQAYELVHPLAPGFEQRLPIYQLYYLLVHVNLFGGGYIRSVRKILDKW